MSILGRLKKFMDQYKQEDEDALKDPEVTDAKKERIKEKFTMLLKCNSIMVKLYK